MKKKIVKLFKRIIRIYSNLALKYGKGHALVMGMCFVLYKIFMKPLIFCLKKSFHKVKPMQIVLESKPDFADNGRALSDYMVEHGYNEKYKIIWLVKEPRKYKKYRAKNVKFILKIGRWHKRRTIRAYYYGLTSKYVIFTHAFRWIKQKTEGQIYINLWHGCGYKASRRAEGNANVFDYCLVPGEVFIETKSEFFNCPRESVIPIGYPRYDLYKKDNENVDRYFASLGGNGRKNVLWMPTFVVSKDLLYYSNPIPAIIGLPLMNSICDLDKLEEICAKANINLIIKRHRIGSRFKGEFAENNGESHVFYLDNDKLDELDIQLYEMIAKSDALITDFSSVAIDYILLDKPIGFTLDSIEDYGNTRGFAFEDPRKYMPGEHLYTFGDLQEFLKHVSEGKDLGKEQRQSIIGETHNPTNDYCKRILDYLDIVC